MSRYIRGCCKECPPHFVQELKIDPLLVMMHPASSVASTSTLHYLATFCSWARWLAGTPASATAGRFYTLLCKCFAVAPKDGRARCGRPAALPA